MESEVSSEFRSGPLRLGRQCRSLKLPVENYDAQRAVTRLQAERTNERSQGFFLTPTDEAFQCHDYKVRLFEVATPTGDVTPRIFRARTRPSSTETIIRHHGLLNFHGPDHNQLLHPAGVWEFLVAMVEICVIARHAVFAPQIV
ncbi:hypothetical protein KM043_002255 [Ampulex compressa]|nr:hypothetical protein KM043_002255 [Ampulex compressa]